MTIDPSQHKRIGMLTPSSNTVLEPVTTAMLAHLPDVTAHFGRFRVTQISLDATALAQFDLQPIVDAALLLADAKVDAIVWNGTSSGWLGFAADRHLCAAIEAATGAKTGTSVLALAEILRSTKATRIGLVSPYLDEIQEKIVTNFASEGFDCIAERHLRDRGNFSFSQYSEATIADLVREVAKEKPDAIAVFCTNMRGGPVVESLEAEIGIPIYDSVATAVWAGLRAVGTSPVRVQGWGRLFREVA